MIDPIAAAKLAGFAVKIHGGHGMPHAIVRDGVVVNVIIWDANEAPGWKPEKGVALPCDGAVAIGHLWDGIRFTDPTPPRAIEPIDEVKQRRISDIDRAY